MINTSALFLTALCTAESDVNLNFKCAHWSAAVKNVYIFSWKAEKMEKGFPVTGWFLIVGSKQQPDRIERQMTYTALCDQTQADPILFSSLILSALKLCQPLTSFLSSTNDLPNKAQIKKTGNPVKKKFQ